MNAPGPGRPRVHASPKDRTEAYQRRAAGKGLVRVSVLVPAGRAADLRMIAGAMRQASAKARGTAAAPRPRDTTHPNARRPWTSADDTDVAQRWRTGADQLELTSGLGRPSDEILGRLVELEEIGSVREGRSELAARGRFR